jgi:hypothetical protein
MKNDILCKNQMAMKSQMSSFEEGWGMTKLALDI